MSNHYTPCAKCGIKRGEHRAIDWLCPKVVDGEIVQRIEERYGLRVPYNEWNENSLYFEEDTEYISSPVNRLESVN